MGKRVKGGKEREGNTIHSLFFFAFSPFCSATRELLHGNGVSGVNMEPLLKNTKSSG